MRGECLTLARAIECVKIAGNLISLTNARICRRGRIISVSQSNYGIEIVIDNISISSVKGGGIIKYEDKTRTCLIPSDIPLNDLFSREGVECHPWPGQGPYYVSITTAPKSLRLKK